jgi:hypothetical protein
VRTWQRGRTPPLQPLGDSLSSRIPACDTHSPLDRLRSCRGRTVPSRPSLLRPHHQLPVVVMPNSRPTTQQPLTCAPGQVQPLAPRWLSYACCHQQAGSERGHRQQTTHSQGPIAPMLTWQSCENDRSNGKEQRCPSEEGMHNRKPRGSTRGYRDKQQEQRCQRKNPTSIPGKESSRHHSVLRAMSVTPRRFQTGFGGSIRTGTDGRPVVKRARVSKHRKYPGPKVWPLAGPTISAAASPIPRPSVPVRSIAERHTSAAGSRGADAEYKQPPIAWPVGCSNMSGVHRPRMPLLVLGASGHWPL